MAKACHDKAIQINNEEIKISGFMEASQSEEQKLKKQLLIMIVTKVLDLMMTKTHRVLLKSIQEEIVIRQVQKIWPHIQHFHIPTEIVKDVEASLFKDLVKRLGNINNLFDSFLAISQFDEEIIQAFKDFLQMSKFHRYVDRAVNCLSNNWHWGLCSICVLAPVAYLLAR